ncbi:MAG: MFS transporter [Sphingomonadales bacterium]|nr:MAG: MFS transporter [Sphingomonadales bacterium]
MNKIREWRAALRNPAIAAMAALFLINVASYADRSILVVLQESIKKDLQLSDFQLGLLAGPAFAIFYSIMGLPIARLAERKSRKKIILVAVSAWSVFTAFCGLAQNFVQLAIFRMGVGAAEAAAPPATHSLIADYFNRSARGRAMAVLALGIPLGLMVGGVFGGLIASAFGWRVAFIAIGLPGLLLVLLGSKIMYEADRGPGNEVANMEKLSTMESIRSLLSIPVYRLLLVAAVLSGNAAHAISTFSASFFIRAHDLSLAEVGGILLTGKGLAGMAGTLTSGFVSDKLDNGRGQDYLLVPASASLVAAGLMWLSFVTPGVTVAMLLFILAAFFANMIMSPAFAAIQNVVDPRTRATAAALFLFCVTVPGSVGPVMVGYLSDMVAAGAMNLDVAAYLSTCPGGRPAAGLAAEVAAQCAPAATSGLRRGMTVALLIYLASVVVYLLAVRAGRISMRQSLATPPAKA